MMAINMAYKRYHFNWLSLTVSLLYSGSAALIFIGLVSTAIDGLCLAEGVEPGVSLFKSNNAVNYLIWIGSAIGLAFQVTAHFYYG